MNRRVLRLALPNIISNLSVPLLGAVDTALVGHLDEVYYLGALAVGGMIFNILFWSFGFLRMGTTGLTAQAYGSGNRPEIILMLARVQLIAVGLGLLIILLQHPIASLSFRILDTSTHVESYARVYYDIRVFTAPAVLALYGLNGWFLGMQNATWPMVITIVLNGLNIALNLFFIRVLDMHVDGVAWGSLISTWLALLLGICLYFRTYGNDHRWIKVSELINTEKLFEFARINRDIFIRTLCLIFTFSFFTAESARQGDLILAANTVLLQYWMIASYGIDGFAYAAESLVGRYRGEADPRQLKRAVKTTMLWGVVIGLAGSFLYGVLGEPILELFTNQNDVIEAASSVMFWTVMAPLVASFCYIWDGVYIGATETGPMRNTMLLATILVFLPVWAIASVYIHEHGLWLAMVSFMTVRGVLLTLYAPTTIFRRGPADRLAG